MSSTITFIDVELCKHIARNSPKVKAMGKVYAEGINRLIYQTAPHTTHHPWAYRDNFRIEQRQFPLKEGHVTYIIAERFQWRWIEYGWTEWRTRKKYPGKYIMTNALKAYGYGDTYGVGVK
jgi:hypothetical protein